MSETNQRSQTPNTLKHQQYANSAKFNARIQLHAKCSTNKYPWPLWVFDQLEKRTHMKILELGCGTGMLWQVNGTRIPNDWEVFVSDFSEGMLNHTRENLQKVTANFHYKLMNAEEIEFPNEFFDIVIANHMLYHVPNLHQALSEISRVLKKEGILYASTIGASNMREMKELLYQFLQNHNYEEALGSVEEKFSLDNGKEILRGFFQDIRIVRYENSLRIIDPKLLVDYIVSCNGLKPGLEVLPIDRTEKFLDHVENIIKNNGQIIATTESGLFVGKKSGIIGTQQ
jgi:ubiquinone/menaquinone biosynthesis C-methylase UbiE